MNITFELNNKTRIQQIITEIHQTKNIENLLVKWKANLNI